MAHEYWEERLQAFLDNELAPADHIAVERHLAECASCKAHADYFSSLKKRLRAHATSIEIPSSVDARIRGMFENRYQLDAQRTWLRYGIGIAAILVLGFLAPWLLQESYQFANRSITGTIVCHDCMVAKKTGLVMGELCLDGHRLGLQTSDGGLYRFASDKDGKRFFQDLSLYDYQVTITGEILEPAKLIRIKSMEKVGVQQRAAL